MLSVIIPTYNAAPFLPILLERLLEQTTPHELIVIDSQSTDNTTELVQKAGGTVVSISKASFNHGTTRNLGLRLAKSDIVVFMTQDALPASPRTIENLITMMRSREDISMAYGRQLPYPETGIFGRFARLANYPENSLIKTRDLIPTMGIKTCSCSNSFAAYYKAELEGVGGFPADTILGEDVSVAARFILRGKAVAYCAEATVFHSHEYSLTEEFKRYFDIGVFHEEQRDILSDFSKAESEGLQYVLQEWKYLITNGHTALIPAQILRTMAKYAGYRLGKSSGQMSTNMKRRLSMQPSFWQDRTIKE